MVPKSMYAEEGDLRDVVYKGCARLGVMRSRTLALFEPMAVGKEMKEDIRVVDSGGRLKGTKKGSFGRLWRIKDTHIPVFQYGKARPSKPEPLLDSQFMISPEPSAWFSIVMFPILKSAWKTSPPTQFRPPYSWK